MRRSVVLCLAVLACGATLVGQPPAHPHLRKQGTATQLIVDGRPFLIRGGELGNSSASNLGYLAPFWPRFSALGLNVEILSPFSIANRDADARAYAALMRHLKTIDGERHTVIMVQTENEIGMIPSARDHSEPANRLFAAAVPGELMEYLVEHSETLAPELRSVWLAAGGRRSGTWTEVFGDGAAAEEVFMAWHFARFTQHVAAAGKAEYPLPMFVNAALIRPGYQPGQYPSAGPLPHLIDVWRASAPAIDFIAPDIYFPTFVEWTRRYVRSGNPLFVPEALRSPDAAVNALYAFGAHDAIGFSPFAIESTPEPAAGLLAASNDVVAQLTPMILEHQGRGTMAGLLQEHPDSRAPQPLTLNGYVLKATFERGPGPSLADGIANPGAAPSGSAASGSPAGGLVIATAPDEFLFAGIGVTVTFAAPEPGPHVGILNVEEGRFVNGKWENLRWLNGDQTHQGRHLRLEPGRFSIQRIRLYRYR